MRIVRPETPKANGTDWTASLSDTNKWHRVIITHLNRSVILGAGKKKQVAPEVVGSAEKVPLVGERRGAASTAAPDGETEVEMWPFRRSSMSSLPSSSPSPPLSLFLVKFEGDRVTTLDLSLFSIRWISFCSDFVGSAVDEVDPLEADDAPGQYRLPPGFDGGDDGGLSPRGGLAFNRSDAGKRVDVWWPRYNSYFRATVRFFRGFRTRRVHGRGKGGRWRLGELAELAFEFCLWLW